MNLYNNQINYYEKKYLKYKKKYMGLRQKGGNIDLLCKIMPMSTEIIMSLNMSYPKIFYNYIDSDYKDIIFLDCDKFISNIEYQLFNMLNFNYDTFRNFYINSLYRNKLSDSEKMQILNTFLKNNQMFDELHLALKPLIIVTLTHYNKKSEHYNFYVEEFFDNNYKLLVIILPEITTTYNLSKLFFINQLLYLNNQLKYLINKNEYTLFSFVKIDTLISEFKERIIVTTCNFAFVIDLVDDETKSYKITKSINKSFHDNNKIVLKYNNKKVNYLDNKLLIFFLIQLIKKKSPIFNVEKYIKLYQITDINIDLIDDEYILFGNIKSYYSNNYLNNYFVNKRLYSFSDYPHHIVATDNDRFFFQYNHMKKIFIERYDNMKNFNMIMSQPIKTEKKGMNSDIFKNYVKDGDNIFSFIYKLKKKNRSEFIDNMFYDYCSSLCANEFKMYFPNFVHTFYYFVYDDVDDSVFYNGIIKIIDEKVNDEQFKQNLYLNCRYMGTSYSEDDYSGIAMEEITDGKGIIHLIEKHLIDNTLHESKLKTTDLFDYILWAYFIQIYTTLNVFKDNFTHYDLHFNNIIYKSVPKDMYIKINYYDKSSDKTTDSIQFSVYTKYIPVIIDYGRANFTCGDLYTKKIADTLCDNNELNKCNVSGRETCDLINLGIHYSETSDEPNNIKNNNISQDLRYFALVMELIIEKMSEKHVSKTNLYIYKKLKKYKLSGWLKKETKYLFFKKVKPNTKQYFVREESTKKGEINNIESFYKYLIDFYNTRIKKILPGFEEKFKSHLYGTIYIDMTKTKPWKFIPA